MITFQMTLEKERTLEHVKQALGAGAHKLEKKRVQESNTKIDRKKHDK